MEWDVCFKQLGPEDLSAMVLLEAACFPDAWGEQAFREALANPLYVYYGAFYKNEHIATAGLLCSSPEADIINVAVAPAYRGKGLAKQLLEVLIRAGQEAGIRDFTLEVRNGSVAAIRTYEALGFVQEGYRKNFYRDPVEDARIYWLRT